MLCARHGHGGHDQQFYTLRYGGYYSAAVVTSFAQALSLLQTAHKHDPTSPDPYKSVLLVIARNWDWESLFNRVASRNVKHFTRPLAWQYSAAEEAGGCAGARYKDWGDASQHWLGEEGKKEGASLEFLAEVPLAAEFRPLMLPLVGKVTGKLQADMAGLCRSPFLNTQEKAQVNQFIESKGDLGWLVAVTGAMDDDMLPGRPGLVSCVRDGKAWSCPVRLIHELPVDMWGLPASRVAAVASHKHLTEQESALLCRSAISSAHPTPSHPRNFPGGRAMNKTEHQQYSAIGSRTKVANCFLCGAVEDLVDTVLNQFTVQDLKDFLLAEVHLLALPLR